MPSGVSTAGTPHDREPTVEELKQALAETRRREAATAEVLRAVHTSATNLQTVFDTIVRSAVALCDGGFSGVYRFDGEFLHHVAHHNYTPGALEQVQCRFPARPTRAMGTGRAILEGAVVHIPEVEADADYRNQALTRAVGMRSALFVPIIRDGAPLGVIVVARAEPGPFSDEHIKLLKIFAEQAAIAIENTRLFEEVQSRTRELRASVEYQTAVGDLLNVISRSKFDLQPVLQSVVETAVRLCRADHAMIYLLNEDTYRFAAGYGPYRQDYLEFERNQRIAPGTGTLVGRTALAKAAVQIADALADPAYEKKNDARIGNIRSMLGVPLMREGEPIGVIGLVRMRVEPFNPREVELVTTFADQAVIAIENTRLFEAEQASKRELQESLQQQTATADVLKAISRSTFDLPAVLDTLVESAARLCEADSAAIHRRIGDQYPFLASYGYASEFEEFMRSRRFVPGRESALNRAVLEAATIQIPDVEEVPAESAAVRQWRRMGGYRTTVVAPLLREGDVIGAIVLTRKQVRPFTDRQIELLETFADQAVIAIENTRLFEAEQARTRELQESLENQTATAEVLGVISRSKFDLEPVLQSVVDTTARFCAADKAIIYRVRDGDYHFAAGFGTHTPEYLEIERATPILPGPGTLVGRTALRRTAVRIEDALADPDYEKKEDARVGNVRSMLGVPLLRDDELIGVIALARSRVAPFSQREVELVMTFADQAVIAIENTRLFEEVQARTRELAKTVEDLEIASQHKNQFVANMSHELRTPLAAILGYAELIQEGFYGALPEKSMDALTRIRSNGKHLLGLINTVLDIAKIESGQFTLNMSEYAIESVVETVRAATESLAQNKNLALNTDVAKSLPIGVGDEQRLTQVLLNLVGNAIKFTDAGEVRVTAKAVNGHLNVTVADTGPGIPLAEQTRIFEQFHQIDSSLTRAKGGTGLGLAIAKQIVEMHGGRIWVESTVGKGSTFQMEIPTRAEFRKRAP